ncbi:CaiB/BaiF CoA transferase family protein [Micromonospora aurantiaca (nom. illeg.)]|uniref:CaiB/BaiF CoA transferase family protein n=1 Tax=Micromonospora aurantiaca (nom. illeg.) TaxID=47850 RepID=UPI003EB6BB36
MNDYARGPLSGLRVIEAGVLLAGPFCGQILGDLGADVIKLEEPGRGDPMREWGRERPYGKSLWFPVLGRNKRSVTLNLRVPEGQEVLRRLAAEADVLVENFRPGTLERWGVGPDVLWDINPRLVIVRVSAYGQSGPYAERAGYGSIGEAMGGIRYTTGDPDSLPSRVGISIGDSLAGTFAAVGAMGALRVAEATGRGQIVDSAIYESVLALMESLVPEYAIGGYIRERTGSILPNIAPSNVYVASDGGMVVIAANQDTVFRRLAEAMAQPELAADPRFAGHTGRGRHQRELDELIAKWCAGYAGDELLELLHHHGVPAGRIYTAKEMLTDPHFAAREAIVRLEHPDLGEFPMQNVVPKLTATPGGIRRVGPELGEHTDEVLRDVAGLDGDEISRLRAAGVV